MDKLTSRKLWLTIISITLLSLTPLLVNPAMWRECVGGVVAVIITYLISQGLVDRAAIPK